MGAGWCLVGEFGVISCNLSFEEYKIHKSHVSISKYLEIIELLSPSALRMMLIRLLGCTRMGPHSNPSFPAMFFMPALQRLETWRGCCSQGRFWCPLRIDDVVRVSLPAKNHFYGEWMVFLPIETDETAFLSLIQRASILDPVAGGRKRGSTNLRNSAVFFRCTWLDRMAVNPGRLWIYYINLYKYI